MIRITLAIVFCSLFLPQDSSHTESGSLTIFPVPGTWSKYQGGPEVYCESNKLFVRIDKGEWMHWSRKDRVEIGELSPGEKHLVAVRCERKPLQSVKFRFSEFKSNHVCVSYDVYGGIYLFDFTTHGWGCKKTP